MKINRLNFSFLQILLFGLTFNHFFKLAKGECPRTHPIKSNNSCTLKYCTEEEFANRSCFVDNEIVKTQYLNNKIILEESNKVILFDIVKYSNGDIVIGLINDTIDENRKFFGLTKNGTYLYGNPNNMSDESFIFIESSNRNETFDIDLFISKDKYNSDYLIFF